MRKLFKLSIGGFTTQKVDRIIKVRNKLQLMFETTPQKQQLSLLVNILPIYFTQKYIDSFCDNSRITEYLEYIETKKGNQKQFRRLKREHHLQFMPPNALNIIYLQTFLHWLTQECPDFNNHDTQYLMELSNLSRPDKWFNQSQKKQPRIFIYHHGPTNSGKSTSAIKELQTLTEHQKGIYMAPLRLLAWEYQQKLQNCSLITGQEKDYRNSNLISCTIEAAPLGDQYDVAVIDQIQMIGDEERGWAWTKAILSIRAKRVHLCGDERAIGIISKILQLTGDHLQQRRYSRLSKLILIHKCFNLQKLQQADCIINFSVSKLIQHRHDINKYLHQKNISTKKLKKINKQIKCKQNKASIIYGRLPPEVRKNQANNFNNLTLPYLVATNAIGMGLNLNIKKIVFMEIQRLGNKGLIIELEDHEIQQIAGRAGRGLQTGYVQCANYRIHKRVKKALSRVNKAYGIQLEHLKDQNHDIEVNLDEQIIQSHKVNQTNTSIPFNNLLQRQMTQKQYQIKQASFYFIDDFIYTFQLYLDQILKTSHQILQIFNYLKSYIQLSDLYFLQGTKQNKPLMLKLQKQNFHISDLLLFHNALSQNKITYSKDKNLYHKVNRAQMTYIKDFIYERKVYLPQFLVKDYQDDFRQYSAMDQIDQLQHYYGLLQNYVWLWNMYQFSFFQIESANKIKEKLSWKINQVLNSNLLTSKQQGQKEGKVLKQDTYQPSYASFETTQKLKQKKQRIRSSNRIISKKEENKGLEEHETDRLSHAFFTSSKNIKPERESNSTKPLSTKETVISKREENKGLEEHETDRLSHAFFTSSKNIKPERESNSTKPLSTKETVISKREENKGLEEHETDRLSHAFFTSSKNIKPKRESNSTKPLSTKETVISKREENKGLEEHETDRLSHAFFTSSKNIKPERESNSTKPLSTKETVISKREENKGLEEHETDRLSHAFFTSSKNIKPERESNSTKPLSTKETVISKREENKGLEEHETDRLSHAFFTSSKNIKPERESNSTKPLSTKETVISKREENKGLEEHETDRLSHAFFTSSKNIKPKRESNSTKPLSTKETVISKREENKGLEEHETDRLSHAFFTSSKNIKPKRESNSTKPLSTKETVISKREENKGLEEHETDRLSHAFFTSSKNIKPERESNSTKPLSTKETVISKREENKGLEEHETDRLSHAFFTSSKNIKPERESNSTKPLSTKETVISKREENKGLEEHETDRLSHAFFTSSKNIKPERESNSTKPLSTKETVISKREENKGLEEHETDRLSHAFFTSSKNIKPERESNSTKPLSTKETVISKKEENKGLEEHETDRLSHAFFTSSKNIKPERESNSTKPLSTKEIVISKREENKGLEEHETDRLSHAFFTSSKNIKPERESNSTKPLSTKETVISKREENKGLEEHETDRLSHAFFTSSKNIKPKRESNSTKPLSTKETVISKREENKGLEEHETDRLSHAFFTSSKNIKPERESNSTKPLSTKETVISKREENKGLEEHETDRLSHAFFTSSKNIKPERESNSTKPLSTKETNKTI